MVVVNVRGASPLLVAASKSARQSRKSSLVAGEKTIPEGGQEAYNTTKHTFYMVGMIP